MHRVVHGHWEKFVLIYIEHALIDNINDEEHLKDFRCLFDKLREHKLYGTLSNYEFLRENID